ncbi:hypothetical protein [Azospirillum argentinense]
MVKGATPKQRAGQGCSPFPFARPYNFNELESLKLEEVVGMAMEAFAQFAADQFALDKAG